MGTAQEHFDRAVDELLHFRAEVVEASDASLAEDPTFPMAIALRAYLGLLTTDVDDAVATRLFLADARPAAPDLQEQAHLDAARRLAAGDFHGAGRTLADLTVEYPRDALALAVGHQIDFFTGNATSLRDRIGAALSAWHPDDRHYPNVLGMYAFGLEEAGHYDRSEDVGREAVDRDPRDVWGIHAVAHTYEMQGRFGDGIRYFDDRLDQWSTDTFFNVHNWWHYGLYAIESGDRDRALSIYDTVLHGPNSSGVSLELLDAAALLWRFELAGDPQPDRWAALVEPWQARSAEAFYAFNDAHAVMAYVGAGRYDLAEALIADRIAWLGTDHPGVSNQAMTARVGLPVCRALVAFGRGQYDEVVDLLAPIRSYVNEFGGSHAQRDAVYKTLVEAAIRAGRVPLARALVSERLNVRPCSPYNWLKQSEVARALGDEAAAVAAATRAKTLAHSGGATTS
ncbi:tetratricopeptide repeat protein [Cryptosporangium phraense]|uniref:Tetratricopeptide repeat protein 38 n=1 Tax=Cryptosporangium phraense TaxID=2593070 RepID=A0A545AT54_9ACTN|nr:tetratricopeptide repeat protein [Cryptosporangium phraense]TQS44519.1 tetratricopeptide repeat protein [Cryptosporangium phraense]